MTTAAIYDAELADAQRALASAQPARYGFTVNAGNARLYAVNTTASEGVK